VWNAYLKSAVTVVRAFYFRSGNYWRFLRTRTERSLPLVEAGIRTVLDTSSHLSQSRNVRWGKTPGQPTVTADMRKDAKWQNRNGCYSYSNYSSYGRWIFVKFVLVSSGRKAKVSRHVNCHFFLFWQLRPSPSRLTIFNLLLSNY
jgi:hypothetical protein